MQRVVHSILLIITTLVLISCGSDQSRVDVSGIESDADILRFEKELVSVLSDSNVYDVLTLRGRYGEFFDMFTHQVLGIPTESDSMIAMNLRFFIQDPEVSEVLKDVDSTFKDVSDIKSGMDDFLKHYQYYFPDSLVPSVFTYVSAFNYAVITTRESIGIGLDMFLGPEYPIYPQMGIPKYLSSRFSREYIVAASIRGWFESDYHAGDVKKELLSQMVHQGKMLYYLELMSPEMPDTIRTGYTSQQIQWCKDNESGTWAFLIENNLLFNTSPADYAKYVNDGPTTTGFPQEAPGKVGAWTGYRIVKEYMNKNSEVTLQELLNEQDANTILEKSGYKPKR